MPGYLLDTNILSDLVHHPRTDGIWPESSKYIEEQFAGLSPEVVHKITCENAAKFYGLIN